MSLDMKAKIDIKEEVDRLCTCGKMLMENVKMDRTPTTHHHEESNPHGDHNAIKGHKPYQII